MQVNSPYLQQATKANKKPIASTLVNAILVIICIMLALLVLAIQTHQQQQQILERNQQNQAKLLANITTSNLPTPYTSDNKTFIFLPKKPSVINTFKIKANSSTMLSFDKVKALGWQEEYGFNDAILVSLLAEKTPSLLIATEFPRRQIIKVFVYAGLYLSLVVITILFTYSYFFHEKTKRRLRYINETANEIVNGNLTKRIPINPSIQDEYSEVSRTLNAMLDKNTQLMQDLRQVNNNIAHDLKSPLNRMRSRMEIALLDSRDIDEYQQALADSINDVDDLLKTFNSLLLMGNLDSDSRNYKLQIISLSEILDNLAELYETVAEDKAHTFRSNIDQDIYVLGNPNLLAQAISNLLENAIKYTPAGGNIQLSLKQQTTSALILVSDTGPGIPKAKHNEVFERFSRLDSARQLPGNGLGMSLVKSILQIHRAKIQLFDNSPGLRIEIRLPVKKKH